MRSPSADLRCSALSTRKASTQVELRSDQSFAISGLLDQRTTDLLDKSPGIASIPILGNLFKSKNVNHTATELVVVVTPTVVDPLHADTEQPVQPDMPIPTLDRPSSINRWARTTIRVPRRHRLIPTGPRLAMRCPRRSRRIPTRRTTRRSATLLQHRHPRVVRPRHSRVLQHRQSESTPAPTQPSTPAMLAMSPAPDDTRSGQGDLGGAGHRVVRRNEPASSAYGWHRRCEGAFAQRDDSRAPCDGGDHGPLAWVRR